MREKIALLVFLLLLATGILYLNQEDMLLTVGNNTTSGVVVTLGEDLTPGQKDEILDLFSGYKDLQDVKIITVSNQEEKQLLSGIVEEELIGTRAISSAYVELMERSSGIEVKTENITSITPFMYANALTTAGIEDARVVIAAPFPVSGTAALAGIMKAFEAASGKKLSAAAKETAVREAAETSRLGEKIGKDNAEKLVYEVKKRVIDNKISDPQSIRKIIIEISGDLNIRLSEADIKRITDLMLKINKLDISINDLGVQLKLLDRNLKEIKGVSGEVGNLWQRLLNFLQNLLAMIKQFWG